MLRRILGVVASAGIAASVMVAVGAGSAAAAPAVTLGGGAGIIVSKDAKFVEVCTLNSIGRDRTGALVGLTAGHCGVAGKTVYAENNRRAGVVGTIVTSVAPRNSKRVTGLDYAVIRFNPAKVRATSAYRGTRITGAGGAGRPGQVACKRGRTTGYDCGVVIGNSTRVTQLVQTCSKPGDSGAPVIVGTRVIGVLRGEQYFTNIAGTGIGFDVPCTTQANPIHNPTLVTLLSAITADLNARNLPGAGYQPI